MKNSKGLISDAVNALNYGNIIEATKILNRIIEIDEKSIEAYEYLCHIACGKREWKLALEYQKKIQQINPNDENSFNLSGTILVELGIYDQALIEYKKSIELNNSNVDVHINLGILFQIQKLYINSIESYKTAISLDKKNFDAYINLGNVYAEIKNYTEALYCYDIAIDLNKDISDLYNNKGNVLKELGNYIDSNKNYLQAIKINKFHPSAYFNRAILLKEMMKLEDSLCCIEEAINININDSELYCVKGNILRELCRGFESREAFNKAITINNLCNEARWALPFTSILPLRNQLNYDIQISNFKNDLIDLRLFLENNYSPDNYKNVGAPPTFYLAYSILNNVEILKMYGDICTNTMKNIFPKAIDNNGNSSLKSINRNIIKLGIIGEHIRDHSVWNAITKGILLKLNKNLFEITIFKLGKLSDGETITAMANSSYFIEGKEGFLDWCNSISDANLDIIIYPEIGMHQLTIQLASIKLAHVQIASWGHPETSGLNTIDYYFSAELFENQDSENNYTEKLIVLPNLGCYIYKNDYYNNLFENKFTIDNHYNLPIVVCPGTLFKYLPEYDWIFIAIIKKIGKLKLIFFNNQDHLMEIFKLRLESIFIKSGLEIEEYVIFLPFLSRVDFASLLKQSTLYLDPIGFSGLNSAIFSIECNLPVVTLKGGFLRSRLASGILERIGLKEIIANNEQEYINIIYKLIYDINYRYNIITKIKKNKYLLYEDKLFISELERNLVAIYKKKQNNN